MDAQSRAVIVMTVETRLALFDTLDALEPRLFEHAGLTLGLINLKIALAGHTGFNAQFRCRDRQGCPVMHIHYIRSHLSHTDLE